MYSPMVTFERIFSEVDTTQQELDGVLERMEYSESYNKDGGFKACVSLI